MSHNNYLLTKVLDKGVGIPSSRSTFNIYIDDLVRKLKQLMNPRF